MKRTMIDPPSGWMYGFPKVIPPEHHHRITEWVVENGYPQKMTESYFYYRMWWVEENDDSVINTT